MVITDGVINFPYVVMTELSESTSLDNVVKLPPPTPISAWPTSQKAFYHSVKLMLNSWYYEWED